MYILAHPPKAIFLEQMASRFFSAPSQLIQQKCLQLKLVPHQCCNFVYLLSFSTLGCGITGLKASGSLKKDGCTEDLLDLA